LVYFVRDGSDDPFAKYNTVTPVMDFSQAEYDNHLRDEDWSQAETTYLFSLLREYDLRFVIVADRYAYNPSAPITSSLPSASASLPTTLHPEGSSNPSSHVPISEGNETGSGALEGVRKRCIEDIKSRYYSVCRRLVRSRPTGDEQGKTTMLQYYAFDKGGWCLLLLPSPSPSSHVRS
jgi:DNA methyltransferase 1-associated protein 1